MSEETLHHVGKGVKTDFDALGKFVIAHKEAAAVIGAATAAGAYFIYKRNQAASNSSGLIPVATDTSSTAPVDTSGLTTGVIAPTAPAAAGYTATDLTNAAQQGYAAGQAYNPATALQSTAVSAASQAGQTLSANCNKVTSCSGILPWGSNSCTNPFRQIPALLGCVGQAAITVGTGVAATVLPAVQTGTQALASYAPQLLTAGLGIKIPGLSVPGTVGTSGVAPITAAKPTAPVNPMIQSVPATPGAPGVFYA